VGRFRERKNLQGSLPFDALDDDSTDASQSAGPQNAGYSSGGTPGKVIRFPQPAGESKARALDVAGSASVVPTEPTDAAESLAQPPPSRPAPVATWGPPPQRAAAARLPPALQHRIAFPNPYAEQPTLLEFPVAPLRARALSACLDGLIVALGYGILFVAFYYAGGRIPLSGSPRLALGPFAVVMAILPLLYLHLFLSYAKQTPGMSWTGLRLVNFDGRPATARQRRRRVWASAASMASLLLGFFWAAVDDEKLTWHDHMSETCLTQEGR
jgi:uncharacterized RDD family membrane protein YckC